MQSLKVHLSKQRPVLPSAAPLQMHMHSLQQTPHSSTWCRPQSHLDPCSGSYRGPAHLLGVSYWPRRRCVAAPPAPSSSSGSMSGPCSPPAMAASSCSDTCMRAAPPPQGSHLSKAIQPAGVRRGVELGTAAPHWHQPCFCTRNNTCQLSRSLEETRTLWRLMIIPPAKLHARAPASTQEPAKAILSMQYPTPF